MFEKNEKQNPSQKETKDHSKYSYLTFLTSMIAIYSLARKGNYRSALLFYPKGGAGLNIYKDLESGTSKRVFALDYHPFWDSKNREYVSKLHFHWGKSNKEMKRHRPYE